MSEEEAGSGQAAAWVRWSVQGMGSELSFDEKVASNQRPGDQASLVHAGARGAVRLE